MTDQYKYIHKASNDRLAEMLETIALDLGISGNLEGCAVIGEAVRRLTTNEEITNEQYQIAS